MIKILRRAGTVLIWALLLFGAVGISIWAATQFNWIQTLVVTSGSMEPQISAGDVLVARPVPGTEIAVGDVVSMPTPALGAIVTHRVVEITAEGFILQGDANVSTDPQPYPIPQEVWRLSVVIPEVGNALLALRNPTTLISLGVMVLALLAASFLPDDDPAPPAEPTAPAATPQA